MTTFRTMTAAEKRTVTHKAFWNSREKIIAR